MGLSEYLEKIFFFSFSRITSSLSLLNYGGEFIHLNYVNILRWPKNVDNINGKKSSILFCLFFQSHFSTEVLFWLSTILHHSWQRIQRIYHKNSGTVSWFFNTLPVVVKNMNLQFKRAFITVLDQDKDTLVVSELPWWSTHVFVKKYENNTWFFVDICICFCIKFFKMLCYQGLLMD